MLATFRKGAHGFLAKLLLGFLVLTFAIWGVGDVFRGAPDNVLAKVGEETITAPELESAIKNAQAQFPELTADVASSLQVRLQFLDQLVNTKLLALEAKSVGLDFSEDALSERIAELPSFQNEQGQFDRERFLAIIGQMRLNQNMFLQRFETDMQVMMLQSALTQSIAVPDELAKLYYLIQKETREASFVILDTDDIPKAAPAEEEALRDLYEDISDQFREPEYRTYRYVYFNSDMIAKNLIDGLDEAALQSYYDQNKDAYSEKSFEEAKPEIEKLLSEQKASDRLIELSNKLDDALAGGATLEESLEGAGLSHLKVETLGPITAGAALKNGELYDMKPVEEEMLQMAFEQEEKDISPITISADQHYYLVETLEVMPSYVPEYEAVKDKLQAIDQDQKARQAVLQKADELLKELKDAENPIAALKERGHQLHDTGSVSRSTREVSLSENLKLPLSPSFMEALYEMRLNEVSSPVTLADGRNAIVILTAIHQAEEPKAEDLRPISEELQRQIAEEAFNAYLGALREKYGVELFIDQIALPNNDA